MSLPLYLNCKSEEVTHCDFYMHKECLETCAYARDIGGLGVGAVCDGGLLERIKDSQKSHNRNIRKVNSEGEGKQMVFTKTTKNVLFSSMINKRQTI